MDESTSTPFKKNQGRYFLLLVGCHDTKASKITNTTSKSKQIQIISMTYFLLNKSLHVKKIHNQNSPTRHLLISYK